MDADLKVRKQVSFAQLKALLEFLGEHQELARGLTRGRRGKLHTFKLWNQCAKKLNLVKDGAVKDGKAWSKYWCDWKYRVRRRALELKAAKTSNRPPPDGVTPLSGMEENILSIIGEGAVDNIVIKSDPLGDEDTVDEELDNNEETLLDQCYEADTVPVKKPRTRKRRHSTREFSELEDLGGTSSPRDKPGVAAAESDSDDDDAAVFLRLEKEKIENARKLHETVLTLTSEITRLTDIMGHIRDVIVNNRINI
ncbi:uncharacterized protein LOC114349619 [Ostrinia furnacalis]|uniref:uncharacterized protein LOC114349619 n=1 Tax=Ostrinia furnacalis TaxID=93504 RepID=UPI00103D0A0A|nr:uncharacterized protein LOC114349619 [Ostrinia furnacalis]